MAIFNKFKTETPAPVVATNDGNAVTGNQSDRWGGINANFVTGATGNATAGDGLTYIAANATYDDQIITKLVQITCTGVFTPAVPNYLKIPLSQVGITGTFTVKGATFLGVFDPDAVNTGIVPTASLVEIFPVAASLGIVKDSIVIRITAASIALFQDKVIGVLLVYSNN